MRPRYTFELLILFLLIGTVSGQSTLTLSAIDRNDQTVPANYTVENSSGVVAQSQDTLSAQLSTSSNYTVLQEFDTFNVTLRDFNLTEDENPEIQVLERTTATPYLQQGEKIYALNATGLLFSKASISYNRSSAPENILRCPDFRFTDSSCNSWNINSTADYPSSQTTVFEFNTSQFSAYTAGDTAPKPRIEKLEVFNVTDLSNQQQRYGGEKIDEGLNKTFTAVQKDITGTFRFTFSVENNGSETWTLSSADTMRHAGLDTSWTDQAIWYNLSGEKTGGSFSSGIISWDTSQDGSLGAGENLTASYIISTSQTDTTTYSQDFKVQDASSGASDQDYHELEAVKVGKIGIDLLEPPNNTLITQNKTFNLSANVTCSEGSCGTITADPRYNTTGGQTLIPSTGTPFELITTYSDSCTLESGSECSLNWRINATGSRNTYHKLDMNASGQTYEVLEDNSSEKHTVEIDLPVSFSLSWEVIDFGALDPGADNQPATGNDNLQYNVTVSEDSKTIDNLWIKGQNLVSTANPDYEIGISNVSYGLTNSVQGSENITRNYSKVDSDLSPGTVLNTFYWIDVPLGMTEGGYNGTITFKANITG